MLDVRLVGKILDQRRLHAHDAEWPAVNRLQSDLAVLLNLRIEHHRLNHNVTHCRGLDRHDDVRLSLHRDGQRLVQHGAWHHAAGHLHFEFDRLAWLDDGVRRELQLGRTRGRSY